MADTNFGDRLEEEYLQGRINVDTEPELPAVPLPTPDLAAVVKSLKALKTVVEALAGRSSTAYDKALTLRDLVDSGMVAIRIGGQVVGSGVLAPPGTGRGSPIVVPVDPGGPGYIDPRPVLLVPPTPTSVTAVGAFRNVIVSWKLLAYKNHAYCEVWRASVNNLALAVRHGTTTANIYIDGTGLSGATYYYWVRAVNTEGALGQFQSTLGVAATLGLLVDDDVPPQFIKHAMIGLLAVDDANIADLNAGKINAGFLSAARIDTGSLHGDKITVNTLSGDRLLANTITAGKINGLDLKVYSGYYTNWNFPGTAGLGGFYLGPEGLRMGNYLSNSYIEITADGDIHAPGLAIVDGSASFSGSLAAGISISAPVITGGSISGTTGTFAGSLSAATGTFAGALSAATGTFAGALSAATGTFAGTLTAAAVDAVDTINIADNAVSVSNFASGSAQTVSTTLTIPNGKTWKVLVLGFQSSATATATSSGTISVVADGTTANSSVYMSAVIGGTDVNDYAWLPAVVAGVASVTGNGSSKTFSITADTNNGIDKQVLVIAFKK